MVIDNIDIAGRTTTEMMGSLNSQIEPAKDLIARVADTVITKEQIAFLVVSFIGLSTLFAIRQGYSFEYDHEKKRFRFNAPE